MNRNFRSKTRYLDYDFSTNRKKLEKAILKIFKYQDLLFDPKNHCSEITRIDRLNVLNCPSSPAGSSTAKIFTGTTNIITKSVLLIPGRDSITESVRIGTSLVGGKFKVKQWKITTVKRTKFNDTSRCIKIRLGNLLQRGVNLGEMARKGGEFSHKCFGINSIKIWQFNTRKRTIRYTYSFADSQQRTLANQQVYLELLSWQTNRTVCRVPSGCSECTCRHGVTKRQG